ncbi:MAG: hypothetical protein ACJ71T_04715 [Actinomycetales bacterium]
MVAELLLTQLRKPLRRSGARQPEPIPAVVLIAPFLPISVAQVSKVLQAFDAQGWTSKSGSERGPGAERALLDAPGLLDAWSSWQSQRPTPSRAAQISWHDPYDFVATRLKQALPPDSWCLSGWLAADLIAPYVTNPPSFTCYVDREIFRTRLEDAFTTAGLRNVKSGGRIAFVEAEPHVMSLAERGPGPDDVPLADIPRIYADLRALGDRGAEAGAHLREVSLGY